MHTVRSGDLSEANLAQKVGSKEYLVSFLPTFLFSVGWRRFKYFVAPLFNHVKKLGISKLIIFLNTLCMT